MRKTDAELDFMVADLDDTFSKLAQFTLEDWTDLDLKANEILEPENYLRFVQMLNQVHINDD